VNTHYSLVGPLLVADIAASAEVINAFSAHR